MGFNGNQRPGGINGVSPLIYQGSTPNMVTFNRRPTVMDGVAWPIGMWWIIPIDTTFTTGEVWTLVSKAEGIFTWKKLHGGGGPIPPTNTLLINKIYLTTAGAGTYTPTTGMTQCYVECVGGGGGSVGLLNLSVWANAGSAGGYCAKLFTKEDIGSSQTYTVGSGGAGGVSNVMGTAVAGGDGSSTLFGSSMVASPGIGGTIDNGMGFSVNIGGSATGGDINVAGGGAIQGWQLKGLGDGYQLVSGTGGSSMYGAGGAGYVVITDSFVNNVDGISGTGYGSGAGGGVSANTPFRLDGTAGQDGIIIITEYLA